jgi:hypothetical protein
MAIKLTVASSENTKISGVQDKVFFLPWPQPYCTTFLLSLLPTLQGAFLCSTHTIGFHHLINSTLTPAKKLTIVITTVLPQTTAFSFLKFQNTVNWHIPINILTSNSFTLFTSWCLFSCWVTLWLQPKSLKGFLNLDSIIYIL